MGHPDFRVRRRIFATLWPDDGVGVVKTTREQMEALVGRAARRLRGPAVGRDELAARPPRRGRRRGGRRPRGRGVVRRGAEGAGCGVRGRARRRLSATSPSGARTGAASQTSRAAAAFRERTATAKGAPMRSIPILAATAAVALVLTACGGSGDGADRHRRRGRRCRRHRHVEGRQRRRSRARRPDRAGPVRGRPGVARHDRLRRCHARRSMEAARRRGGERQSGTGGVGTLGVVTHPDGSKQVTVAGRPLYTFTQEGPGQVTGNGVADAFGARASSGTPSSRAARAPAATGGSSTPRGYGS